MNRALYYISSILCWIYAANAAFNAIIYHLTKDSAFSAADLIIWFSTVLFVLAGWLFMRKYHQDISVGTDFDKGPVVSVIGIVCFIIGLVWLSSEMRFVIEVSRMPSAIGLSIIHQILAPIVLLCSGIYFGFLYPPTRLTSS